MILRFSPSRHQVPKVMEWLKEVVPEGGKVAADPKLVSAETWKTYSKDLTGERERERVIHNCFTLSSVKFNFKFHIISAT